MFELDAVAVRVLGSLIEKEITTPDNYPLTLNALVTACNQTSNRDPVLALDEKTVAGSLEDLTARSLVRGVHRGGSRVRRFRQAFSESMSLHDAETAAMCVLMLRGAQTMGEIRSRAARLFEFPDLQRVELTLQALMDLPQPLVAELPRRPGQKEARYAHLLSGDVPEERAADELHAARTSRSEPNAAAVAPAQSAQSHDRVDVLEQAVEELRAELTDLRATFDAFVEQFR